MATLYTTKPAPFGAITTFRAIHALENVKNAFAAWNANRNTYNQLNALTARELEDIGLSRMDVENMNNGFFGY
jgi:uncharacterized protein YjiS (DUF1127 family)